MRGDEIPTESRGSMPSDGPAAPFLVPFALALALLVLAFTPPPAAAQLGSSQSASANGIRVYLDCQNRRHCDRDHFRQELDYVDWVRDRTAANVHLIFTSSGAGSGRYYQLDFVGREGLEGLDDQLSYTASGRDVESEIIDGLTHALHIGLVRFMVEAGMGSDLDIRFVGAANEGGEAGERPDRSEVDDPWNFWTFRFGLSGSLDMEERRDRRTLRPSLRADRTTERWKINFSAWSNIRRDRIELSDGSEVRDDQNNWSLSGLVVRSVSSNFSVGVDAGARNSVRRNQRTRVYAAPALEWNYYPYMEATRRQLIAHYAVGFEYADYHETTVFEQDVETNPHHRLAIQYNAREEWGNAGLGVETAQYLHDSSLYSVGFRGRLNYRIRRGLELEVSGSASMVNDQIYLPQEDAGDEDVLLGRSALPTGHEYEASIGFNYEWGSIFDNIVNSRFPRAVR